jgi:O-acetyl-ADP-ribose deacetylase (regulator of RNase III)
MDSRKVRVAQGSLTEGTQDVLINASNTNLELGSGVSGAIRQACGPKYQAYLAEQLQARCGGPMAPGEVLLTDAGTHPNAKYVAHAAIMDYRQGFTGSSYPTIELVEQSYARIWNAIADLGEDGLSIAIVALGAGTGQLGARAPMERACKTLIEFLSGPRAGAIGDLCFYGYSLVDYIATVEAVTRHFVVPPETLDPEVLAYMQADLLG